MTVFVDNHGQFFVEFLSCVKKRMSSEYEPNRMDSVVYRLNEYERTVWLDF